MMAGLLQPTAGSVEIGGFDVQKDPLRAKAITGFIPDRPYLYEKLTAEEFMRFVAELYNMTGPDARIRELLDAVRPGRLGRTSSSRTSPTA